MTSQAAGPLGCMPELLQSALASSPYPRCCIEHQEKRNLQVQRQSRNWVDSRKEQVSRGAKKDNSGATLRAGVLPAKE